uniref:Phorbol-ester/DAG-type domain-containing protein n=1 Tax=Macrostomum lignano TaxID=282301 RepID=A0A1I8IXU0_9PLAT
LSNLSKKVDQLPAAASAGSQAALPPPPLPPPQQQQPHMVVAKMSPEVADRIARLESQVRHRVFELDPQIHCTLNLQMLHPLPAPVRESVTSTLSSLMTAVQSLKAATESSGGSPGHRRRGHSRPREADADGDSMEPSFSHGAAGKGGTPRPDAVAHVAIPWCRRPGAPAAAARPAGLGCRTAPVATSRPSSALRSPTLTASLAFNTFDEASGSERRSFAAAPYSLDAATGRPLNPAGRTGLAGRGRLPAWGPNHRALLLVTRWSDKERRGKRALELLALPADSGEGGYRAPELPARRLPIDGDCRRLLADAQQRQGGQAPLTVPEAAAARLSEVTAAAGPGFGGAYLDDELNTDSAWLELRAFCLHDDTGGLWDGVRLKLDSKSRPRWTELSHKSESKFPPGHWRCLEKLIQLRNASEPYCHACGICGGTRGTGNHCASPAATSSSCRQRQGSDWPSLPARPDKLLVHHPAEGVQLSFRILVLRQHRRHVGQVTLDRLERQVLHQHHVVLREHIGDDRPVPSGAERRHADGAGVHRAGQRGHGGLVGVVFLDGEIHLLQVVEAGVSRLLHEQGGAPAHGAHDHVHQGTDWKVQLETAAGSAVRKRF